MISYNSYVPIYYRIQQNLRESVNCGIYKAGDQIPTEQELCKQFAVSRITVRQALQALENDGMIIRKPGKGTFVSPKKITKNFNILQGFARDISDQKGTPSAQMIEFKQVHNLDDYIANRLNIKKEEPVYRFVRLRLADEEPLALKTSYIPVSTYPKLDQEDLRQNPLYDILESHEVHLQKSHVSVEVRTATPYEAELLLIRSGIPLLCTEEIVYNEQGKPVEYVCSTYRGDRFKFELTVNK